MSELTMPDHSQVRTKNAVQRHLKTQLVANCANCRPQKVRVKMRRGQVMRPDCSHALVWERISPEEIKERHEDWLKSVRKKLKKEAA